MNRQYLENRTALITGAARRIGKAIALALADCGVNVVVHYHTAGDEVAEEVAQSVRSRGAKAWTVKGDLSRVDEIEGMFSNALGRAGSINFLINNASIFPSSRIGEITSEEFIGTLTINSVAPLMLAQSFAAHTKEGVIVNLLDSRIQGYDREHVSYQISKKVLFHLTEMMAVEYALHIRVNGVAPDLILPPEGKDQSYLEQQSRKSLLQRPGTVEDVTDAVLFLLSQRYTTGQVLFVDGGRRLKRESS